MYLIVYSALEHNGICTETELRHLLSAGSVEAYKEEILPLNTITVLHMITTNCNFQCILYFCCLYSPFPANIWPKLCDKSHSVTINRVATVNFISFFSFTAA